MFYFKELNKLDFFAIIFILLQSSLLHAEGLSKHLDDRSIYVLQPRAYSKHGKFEVTPVAFAGFNSRFVSYGGAGLSLAYHFRENFSIEFLTSIPFVMLRDFSELTYEAKKLSGVEPERVDMKQMTYFGALNFQYSPLYGKFSLFKSILIDYDFYFSTGLGAVSTLESCVEGTARCQSTNYTYGVRSPENFSDRVKFSGALGGGVRVFFSEFLGLRFDVRDFIYADLDRADNSTEIQNRLMLFLGASFLI